MAGKSIKINCYTSKTLPCILTGDSYSRTFGWTSVDAGYTHCVSNQMSLRITPSYHDRLPLLVGPWTACCSLQRSIRRQICGLKVWRYWVGIPAFIMLICVSVCWTLFRASIGSTQHTKCWKLLMLNIVLFCPS